MDDRIIKDIARDFLFDVSTGTLRNAFAIVEEAIRHGYEMGKQDGLENLEATCDASFDRGFEYGKTEGALESEVGIEDAMSDSFDDGYLDGVSDARRFPDFASETVQDIINDRAAEHFEALGEYDETLVRDSGDEA